MVKTALRIILVVMGVILVGIIAVTLFGLTLPREHSAVVTARFSVPVDTMWGMFADHEREAEWREDIDRIERVEDLDGHPVWREYYARGMMDLADLEIVPGEKIVREIVNNDGGFGGTWTTTLVAVDSMTTEVTVRETGYVDNPFFRVLLRYVYGVDATIHGYLTMMGQALGVQPEFADR